MTTVAAGALLAGCGGSSGGHTATHHVAKATSTPATTTVTTQKTSSLPTKTSKHKFKGKGCPPVCGY